MIKNRHRQSDGYRGGQSGVEGNLDKSSSTDIVYIEDDSGKVS
jgi:hypothetical protein